MPGYKGHLTGGLVTGGLAIGAVAMLGREACNPLQFAALLSFCLLGALFPDTDTDSKGQNLFYAVFVIIDGTLIYRHEYQLAAWLGLFAMLPALGHHRGWTHSWLAMVLVGSPIVILPAIVLGTSQIEPFLLLYISFTLGYFSHLLLDRIL
jgi:membrane-bound metal-dependent hydrolase YbcI (DUF457 family)